jgi:N-acetylglutamate synthase-like GNAT family acetyltransferase
MKSLKNIKIREAEPLDFEKLENILIQNNMLHTSEIDGKESMYRIKERMGRYFLIAEMENSIVGLVRGVYDGSRALVHQIAIDIKYQKQGIGTILMSEIALRFKEDGASTIAVTSTKDAESFYKKLKFFDVQINCMVAFDINKCIR